MVYLNEEYIDNEVFKRFKFIQKLGKGAYGVVWKCKERTTNEVMAIKKIYGAFQNATDAQRTYREVMFLKKFSNHRNIVKLLEVIMPENGLDFYVLFEYMEIDLHVVVCANILSDIHKRYVMYQILKAIKYIHSGGVIHRDLKPSNILLNSSCLVKIADFGLARSIEMKSEDKVLPVMTDYVATRWYRAPEILLGSTDYTRGIDMWSIGCIFGEILSGRPMFPGSSTINQLCKIISVVGMPDPEDIESLKSNLASMVLENIPLSSKKQLELFDCPPDALDLLKKLIQFNPNKRISVGEALAHQYVSQFHNPEEEIDCDRVVSRINDNEKYSIDTYRSSIVKDFYDKNAISTAEVTCLERLSKLEIDGYTTADKSIGVAQKLTSNVHGNNQGDYDDGQEGKLENKRKSGDENKDESKEKRKSKDESKEKRKSKDEVKEKRKSKDEVKEKRKSKDESKEKSKDESKEKRKSKDDSKEKSKDETKVKIKDENKRKTKDESKEKRKSKDESKEKSKDEVKEKRKSKDKIKEKSKDESKEKRKSKDDSKEKSKDESKVKIKDENKRKDEIKEKIKDENKRKSKDEKRNEEIKGKHRNGGQMQDCTLNYENLK